MTLTVIRRSPWAACVALLVVCTACARTNVVPASSPTPASASQGAAAAAAPDAHAGHLMAAPSTATSSHADHMTALPPVKIPPGAIFTEADVRFMQMMIAHHAQAIYMSRLAVSHGASARLQRLAQKIDQSQAGEIVLMQEWLRANGQFAPDTSSWRTMNMVGMLTTAELVALDAARNTDFDRTYLVSMIRHHQGALLMVAELFATARAAQDVDVSVFANDVENVQTAEIALMQQMLMEM